MAFSIIRLISNLTCWASFVLGILFNTILIKFIIRHTPKTMQIYSKILLQTCVTDIVLLTMTVLFVPAPFTSKTGISESISGGLISFSGSENRELAMASRITWVFLVYVSMFGYVSQFIYRYLVLIWDKKVSWLGYFAIFGATLTIPLSYCVLLTQCLLPPPEHAILDDQKVADILGINITAEQILLTGYSPKSWLMSFAFYYIIIFCTFAYVIMCILGWLMHRFLRTRSKLGASSSMSQQVIKMNKQISRNLIIQAAMPFLIYLSLLLFLAIILFKIDVSSWWWLQYFNLLICAILMYLPSAINPLVSIAIIGYYRRAFMANIGHLVKRFPVLRHVLFCCRHPQDDQQGLAHNQPHQVAVISANAVAPKQPTNTG